jgi:hypothetical protein
MKRFVEGEDRGSEHVGGKRLRQCRAGSRQRHAGRPPPQSSHQIPGPPGEGGVDTNGLLKELLCENVVVRGDFEDMPQAALIGGPSIEVSRWLSYSPSKLSVPDRRGDRNRHSLCDLVLQGENIGEIAIIALGPDVLSGLRLDQLRSHPDAIGGLARATNSCSGSPLIFVKGNTAIDGLSGRGNASAGAGKGCSIRPSWSLTRYTRTGRAMFLTCCSLKFSKV